MQAVVVRGEDEEEHTSFLPYVYMCVHTMCSLTIECVLLPYNMLPASSYMYICVYVHVYICTCMHIHMYICMHAGGGRARGDEEEHTSFLPSMFTCPPTYEYIPHMYTCRRWSCERKTRRSTPCVPLLQNVFSYHTICSPIIECVPLYV